MSTTCLYLHGKSYTNNQQSFLSKLLCFDKRGTESKVALIILVIHLGSYPGMRSGGGLWGWVLRGLITLPRRKKDTKEVLLIHLPSHPSVCTFPLSTSFFQFKLDSWRWERVCFWHLKNFVKNLSIIGRRCTRTKLTE